MSEWVSVGAGSSREVRRAPLVRGSLPHLGHHADRGAEQGSGGSLVGALATEELLVPRAHQRLTRLTHARRIGHEIHVGAADHQDAAIWHASISTLIATPDGLSEIGNHESSNMGGFFSFPWRATLRSFVRPDKRVPGSRQMEPDLASVTSLLQSLIKAGEAQTATIEGLTAQVASLKSEVEALRNDPQAPPVVMQRSASDFVSDLRATMSSADVESIVGLPSGASMADRAALDIPLAAPAAVPPPSAVLAPEPPPPSLATPPSRSPSKARLLLMQDADLPRQVALERSEEARQSCGELDLSLLGRHFMGFEPCDQPKPASEPSVLAKDEFLLAGFDVLRNTGGLPPGHIGPKYHVLESWMQEREGQAFLDEQKEHIDLLVERARDGANGKDLLGWVRVVQVYNKERGPLISGVDMGQDQLQPMFDFAMLHAAPRAAYTALDRMLELANSLQGQHWLTEAVPAGFALATWEIACASIANLAIDRWRQWRLREMLYAALAEAPAVLARCAAASAAAAAAAEAAIDEADVLTMASAETTEVGVAEAEILVEDAAYLKKPRSAGGEHDEERALRARLLDPHAPPLTTFFKAAERREAECWRTAETGRYLDSLRSCMVGLVEEATEVVWISLEPRTGSLVDVYPRAVSARLEGEYQVLVSKKENGVAPTTIKRNRVHEHIHIHIHIHDRDQTEPCPQSFSWRTPHAPTAAAMPSVLLRCRACRGRLVHPVSFPW